MRQRNYVHRHADNISSSTERLGISASHAIRFALQVGDKVKAIGGCFGFKKKRLGEIGILHHYQSGFGWRVDYEDGGYAWFESWRLSKRLTLPEGASVLKRVAGGESGR